MFCRGCSVSDVSGKLSIVVATRAGGGPPRKPVPSGDTSLNTSTASSTIWSWSQFDGADPRRDERTFGHRLRRWLRHLSGNPPHNRPIATMPSVSLRKCFSQGVRRTALSVPASSAIKFVRGRFQVEKKVDSGISFFLAVCFSEIILTLSREEPSAPQTTAQKCPIVPSSGGKLL